MKINVSGILKNNQFYQEVDIEEKIEDISINGNNIKFLEPVKLKGILTNESGTLRLKGEIELNIELGCHRCLESFNEIETIMIDERFINSEKELDDYYNFSNNEIDLMPMVMDNIIINLPMKILCNEGCKGLCEICGANKNIKECNCTKEHYDYRFEALLRLKNNW